MNSLSQKRTDSAENSGLRLQRVLAMAGIASRRHCEEYIETGRVTVDGKTVTELGSRVNPELQEVRLDGERLRIARPLYYVLNKPRGYLCTNQDPGGRLRAIDLLPKDRGRLFTVGRLDENSTGLLLCTNDGELANRLAHPRFRVRKIYEVQVAGIPSRESLQQMTDGLYFADGRFRAESVRLNRVRGQSAYLEVELAEGQNREIRRLLARIGHKVISLERVSLGPLHLGTLPVGEHRMLTPAEVRLLQEFSLGGTPQTKESRRPRGGRSAGKTSRSRASGKGAGAPAETGNKGHRPPSRGRKPGGSRSGRPPARGSQPSRQRRKEK